MSFIAYYSPIKYTIISSVRHRVFTVHARNSVFRLRYYRFREKNTGCKGIEKNKKLDPPVLLKGDCQHAYLFRRTSPAQFSDVPILKESQGEPCLLRQEVFHCFCCPPKRFHERHLCPAHSCRYVYYL
jgi:hypothetical protein